jgi:dTDP-alpha-D-glucuronic acid decarboxylase
VSCLLFGLLRDSRRRRSYGVAHVQGIGCAGPEHDVVALAIKIANVDSVSGAEAINTAAHYAAHYEDIPRRIPDSTKAQRELGWRLQVDFGDGIRRTIDWARANPWYLKESTRNQP